MKKLNSFNQRLKSWCCMHCPLYFKGWQRWQILALVALALLSLASLAWGNPVSGWAGDPRSSGGDPRSSEGGAVIEKITSTPVPVGLSETSTPYPPEILNNHEQTNGVVFLGGLIVLIIVVGTIGVNRSRRKE
jgi:hypothetical protein